MIGKFYNREESKYCEKHKEVGLEVCGKCGLTIEGTSIIVAGKSYHATCFICGECEAPIIDKFYTREDGRLVVLLISSILESYHGLWPSHSLSHSVNHSVTVKVPNVW